MKRLLILMLATIQFSSAQDDLSNHKKYWYYKTRLINDLMKVGLNDGESIPFKRRSGHDVPPNITIDNQVIAGDAAAQLGTYLAVLATEYKLLKSQSQVNAKDIEIVLHEIFCALSAINRLDFKAESILDASKANALNGFFVRDDIPSDFVLNNYKHFNYFSTTPPTSFSDAKPSLQTKAISMASIFIS